MGTEIRHAEASALCRGHFDGAMVLWHGGGTAPCRSEDPRWAAACVVAVTWYYTHHTEHTGIPQENKDGYEGGNAMTYAKNLKGRLLIYYGTADNNVHPNNSMQLIRALQQARKSFEVQVGPDAGHSGVDNQRMMEFFLENLVARPDRLATPGGR
jgi:dipeptidyl aminopeptidase/acylaminoacyl peptidase